MSVPHPPRTGHHKPVPFLSSRSAVPDAARGSRSPTRRSAGVRAEGKQLREDALSSRGFSSVCASPLLSLVRPRSLDVGLPRSRIDPSSKPIGKDPTSKEGPDHRVQGPGDDISFLGSRERSHSRVCSTHTQHHELVLFGGGRGFFSSQCLLSWTPGAWAEKGRGLQDPGPSEQASSPMKAGWVHILGGGVL